MTQPHHPHGEPDLATAAITRRRGRDHFVQPAGIRRLPTLGFGNAVFLGGITMISAEGQRTVLMRPRRVWVASAFVMGLWAVTMIALAVALDIGSVVSLLIMGLMTIVFGAIGLGALLNALYRRRQRLVIDARSGTCDEIVGSKTTLSVPARLMHRVRVQSTYQHAGADDSGGWYHHVLIDLGFAELWLHQAPSEEAAIRLAQAVAHALGVAHDPEIHRER